jgi:CBS domain-containing protein
MRVVELMTKDPVTVWRDTSLADVAGLMDKHHVNGLPVIDEANRLIGIITQGDLLRRPELGTDRQKTSWMTDFFLRSRVEDDYVHTHGRHAGEVMARDPYFVSPDSELAAAAELMTDKHLKCLPVVRDTVLVGVICRSDIVRALAGKLISLAEASDAVDSSDNTIKNNILSSIADEKWMPKTGIRVAVKAGIVNLDGIIFSDSERRMVTVIAENALGAKHVNDHLVYVDAGSGMPFQEQT